jgi:hypothetical protein
MILSKASFSVGIDPLFQLFGLQALTSHPDRSAYHSEGRKTLLFKPKIFVQV